LAMKSEKLWLVREGPASNVSGVIMAYHSLQATVKSQQSRIEQLQNELARASADNSPDSQTAHQLAEARFLAGLTKVRGPGIVITLRDSTKRPPPNLPNTLNNDLTSMYIIHDLALQRVLNELSAGGAEALAINDQRIVATTSVRCVGPAIQVNGVPLAPPYVIRAIGDPQNLGSTLKLPGGIGEMLRSTDPTMMTVAEQSKIELPAYAGAQSHYAKPLEPEISTANGKSRR